MKGIRGLTSLLEQVQKPVNMSAFAGKRVAVDGHDWLHAGAFPFASEFARGVETKAYISYFMDLVNMLQSHKVVPIFVFSCQSLPMKKHMHDIKTKQRQFLIQKGNALYEKGKLTEANKCFQKAFTVTQAMTRRVIEELDQYNVLHIVAPFEAEAQLTYFSDTQHVKAVISQNPNLLAFGVSNIIFNMDLLGHGQQVKLDHVLDLMKFDLLQFRYLCILSDTDLLPSLREVGFKSAQEIVKKERTLEEILKMVQDKYPKRVADYFSERFHYLNDAYMYQFVINIHTRTYVRLNELPNYAIKDLGKTPEKKDRVPLLWTNNATFIDDEERWKNADKENKPCPPRRVVEFVDMKKKSTLALKSTIKPLQTTYDVNWITGSHTTPTVVAVKLKLPLPSYTPPPPCSLQEIVLPKRKNTFDKCSQKKTQRL